MKAYADIASLPENHQIRLIAETAAGQIVAFVVETDEKADRYIQKLSKYPVRVIDRKHTPINDQDMVVVRVGPKES